MSLPEPIRFQLRKYLLRAVSWRVLRECVCRKLKSCLSICGFEMDRSGEFTSQQCLIDVRYIMLTEFLLFGYWIAVCRLLCDLVRL